MNVSFTTFEKVTMNDKSFAYDLLVIYIGELKDYLQQLVPIIAARDVGAYRFLNHKVRSTVNTLEASSLLEAQVNLQQQMAKGASQQEINELHQKLVSIVNQLITALEERKKYYAEFDNQPA
jgi:hypothetical protein